MHNGVVPVKISGPLITTEAAHLITDDSTSKGKDPNINIIEGDVDFSYCWLNLEE